MRLHIFCLNPLEASLISRKSCSWRLCTRKTKVKAPTIISSHTGSYFRLATNGAVVEEEGREFRVRPELRGNAVERERQL